MASRRKDKIVNPNLVDMLARHRGRGAVTDRERDLGLQGRVTARVADFFANQAARTGYGSPNLGNGAAYPLVRFTYNYWQLIAMYEGSWLTRRIVELPAQSMVKAWPNIVSDMDPKDLSKLDRALRRTMAKSKMLTAITWARLFGGAGCLIALKNQEHELDKELDLDSVELGGFQGLIPFDRWSGITPDGSPCVDLNHPVDFGLPEFYTVRAPGGESFKIHCSRVIRFTGPTVPTPEKEAYSGWGISVIEPVLQDIEKYDNISFNILALTFRANILGLTIDDMAGMLSGLNSNAAATEKFAQRMQQINEMLSNQSLVLLPKEGQLSSTQYSFGGLSEVFQQFQLAVSGAAGIPVSRLWGKTVSGLGNGTNEGDERVYEERIANDQEEQLRPALDKLYPVICASELGEVPDGLDLKFPSIRVLDQKDRSELAKAGVDTVIVALNAGIISPKTAAKELRQLSDDTGVFTNITDEDIEKLPDAVEAEGEVGQGLFPEGGGLNPASSPAKALREENKTARLHQEEEPAGDDDGEWPALVEVEGDDDLARAADVSNNVPAGKWIDHPKFGRLEGPYDVMHTELLARRGVRNWTHYDEWPKGVFYKVKGKKHYHEQRVFDEQAEALNAAPAGLKPGDKLRVNGKTLIVRDVVTGTQDLFGNPTVQVRFTTGEVVPYRVDGDVRTIARDADGPAVETRTVHDLPVVIETRKGEIRSGPGWSQIMPYDYGYFNGHEGADGDSLDVALGPESNGWVYLIDQRRVPPNVGFDETKVFTNWPSAKAALAAFHAGHHRAADVLMDWTPMRVEEFKKWLVNRDVSKPAGSMPS